MRANEFEDETTRQVKFVFKSILIGVSILAIFIILFGTFYTVNAGERAIVLTFRSPSETTYGSGLHIKFPLVQGLVIMPTRTLNIAFDNEDGTNNANAVLFAGSKDLQDVQISVIVNYHIADGDVVQIYRQYGTMANYQRNILEPIVRDTVKTISATFTAEELMQKRAEFSDDVAKVLTEKFTSKSAVFERINIVNFKFSDEFTKSIENKVTMFQNALAEKNKLEQVKYQAQQIVEKAQAEATALSLQKAQVTPELVALRQIEVQAKMIEKWSGNLPSVMCGSNGISSFIDLSKYAGTS